MTVVTPTQTAYSAVSASSRIQVRGGRVFLADSNAPAANDYHVLPDGAILEVTAAKYVQALDPGAYLVTQAL